MQKPECHPFHLWGEPGTSCPLPARGCFPPAVKARSASLSTLEPKVSLWKAEYNLTLQLLTPALPLTLRAAHISTRGHLCSARCPRIQLRC